MSNTAILVLVVLFAPVWLGIGLWILDEMDSDNRRRCAGPDACAGCDECDSRHMADIKREVRDIERKWTDAR